MDRKNIKVKGLLITGPEMYAIPALAIVGLIGVVSAAGYGMYNVVAKIINTEKEKYKLKKSTDEFEKYVDSLKEGDLKIN